MKKLAFASLLAAQMAFAGNALAVDPAALSVTLGSITNGDSIPEKYAYCAPDGNGQTKDGGNVNPAINWSGAPGSAKSFALIVVDPDVPASFDDANKPGKNIAPDFPRQNFYHWVLVDIPVTMIGIAEGADSKDKKGKPPGRMDYGINGQNDYAKSGKDLGGGYNGPCPPWNDERVHHYHFMVYALDVPTLNLNGNFGGKQAEAAMEGHVLAKGESVGTYTNNPKLR